MKKTSNEIFNVVHCPYLLSCETTVEGRVEILNINSHCPHLLSGETTVKNHIVSEVALFNISKIHKKFKHPINIKQADQ